MQHSLLLGSDRQPADANDIRILNQNGYQHVMTSSRVSYYSGIALFYELTFRTSEFQGRSLAQVPEKLHGKPSIDGYSELTTTSRYIVKYNPCRQLPAQNTASKKV